MNIKTEHRFYKLADFLGISLHVEKNEVSGMGKFKANIGFAKLHLGAEVRSGSVDNDYRHVALVLAVGADLGVVVFHDLETEYVRLGVFKRSLVKSLSKLLKDFDFGNTTKVQAELLKAKTRYFEGAIGKVFVPVT